MSDTSSSDTELEYSRLRQHKKKTIIDFSDEDSHETNINDVIESGSYSDENEVDDEIDYNESSSEENTAQHALRVIFGRGTEYDHLLPQSTLRRERAVVNDTLSELPERLEKILVAANSDELMNVARYLSSIRYDEHVHEVLEQLQYVEPVYLSTYRPDLCSNETAWSILDDSLRCVSVRAKASRLAKDIEKASNNTDEEGYQNELSRLLVYLERINLNSELRDALRYFRFIEKHFVDLKETTFLNCEQLAENLFQGTKVYSINDSGRFIAASEASKFYSIDPEVRGFLRLYSEECAFLSTKGEGNVCTHYYRSIRRMPYKKVEPKLFVELLSMESCGLLNIEIGVDEKRLERVLLKALVGDATDFANSEELAEACRLTVSAVQTELVEELRNKLKEEALSELASVVQRKLHEDMLSACSFVGNEETQSYAVATWSAKFEAVFVVDGVVVESLTLYNFNRSAQHENDVVKLKSKIQKHSPKFIAIFGFDSTIGSLHKKLSCLHERVVYMSNVAIGKSYMEDAVRFLSCPVGTVHERMKELRRLSRNQDLLGAERMQKAVTRALIETTSAVGVSLERCLREPLYSFMLQYVPGLGAKSAAQLLSVARERSIASRGELKLLVNEVVFTNAAGFLMFENANPLENTLIHPSQYGIALQLCALSLTIEQFDEDDYSLVAQALKDSHRLEQLADAVSGEGLDPRVCRFLIAQLTRSASESRLGDLRVFECATGLDLNRVAGTVVKAVPIRAVQNGALCNVDEAQFEYTKHVRSSESEPKRWLPAFVHGAHESEFYGLVGELDGMRLQLTEIDDLAYHFSSIDYCGPYVVPKVVTTPFHDHLLFRPFSSVEARDYLLKTGEQCVVRPSSQGESYVSVTFQYPYKIIAHISARIEVIDDKRVLIVDGRGYDDVDELIVRHVNVLRSNMERVVDYKRSCSPDENLSELFSKNKTQYAAYVLQPLRNSPGIVAFAYSVKSEVRKVYVTVKATGFEVNGRVYKKIDDVVVYLKQSLHSGG